MPRGRPKSDVLTKSTCNRIDKEKLYRLAKNNNVPVVKLGNKSKTEVARELGKMGYSLKYNVNADAARNIAAKQGIDVTKEKKRSKLEICSDLIKKSR